MADTCEVPNTDPNKRAGYEFDPYADPCQRVDIHSPLIPFHNYRQIHVGEIGFFNGFRAKTLADIVPCPPLWQDVAHYYDTMSELGYEASHPEIRPKTTTITASLKYVFTTIEGEVDWKVVATQAVAFIAGLSPVWLPIVKSMLGVP